MKKNRKEVIKKALKIIFSIGLILFLFYKIDLSVFSNLDAWILFPLFLGILITLISLTIMAKRWKVLIRYFLQKNIEYLTLLRYYLIGSFFNIFMPGAIGGDIIRMEKVVSHYSIPRKSSGLIIISERIAGFFGLALLLSLCLTFLNFPKELNIQEYFPIAILQSSPLVVLSCIPLVKILLERYNTIVSYRLIFTTTMLSLMSQIGDILLAFIFSRYFGVEIPFQNFFFIMPLVYLATVLPISLGGLGVREGAFTGLMVFYGVDTSIAILIAFLLYLSKVGAGIIGYFFYIKDK